jgi:hypothetical protein
VAGGRTARVAAAGHGCRGAERREDQRVTRRPHRRGLALQRSAEHSAGRRDAPPASPNGAARSPPASCRGQQQRRSDASGSSRYDRRRTLRRLRHQASGGLGSWQATGPRRTRSWAATSRGPPRARRLPPARSASRASRRPWRWQRCALPCVRDGRAGHRRVSGLIPYTRPAPTGCRSTHTHSPRLTDNPSHNSTV